MMIRVTSYNKMSLQKVISFLLVGALVSLSFALGAVEDKAALEKETDSQPFKGVFLQSKNIKPLKRPFKSEGGFVYLPNKGLLWHTQKPVDSLKLFANDGVYKVDEQGILQKEAQIDNDFFLALFAADVQKLEKYFTTELIPQNVDSQVSCLALTPISNTMKSLFKSIDLCFSDVDEGVKIPTKIVLTEVKGNITEIQLHLTLEQISPKELAYFE